MLISPPVTGPPGPVGPRTDELLSRLGACSAVLGAPPERGVRQILGEVRQLLGTEFAAVTAVEQFPATGEHAVQRVLAIERADDGAPLLLEGASWPWAQSPCQSAIRSGVHSVPDFLAEFSGNEQAEQVGIRSFFTWPVTVGDDHRIVATVVGIDRRPGVIDSELVPYVGLLVAAIGHLLLGTDGFSGGLRAKAGAGGDVHLHLERTVQALDSLASGIALASMWIHSASRGVDSKIPAPQIIKNLADAHDAVVQALDDTAQTIVAEFASDSVDIGGVWKAVVPSRELRSDPPGARIVSGRQVLRDFLVTASVWLTAEGHRVGDRYVIGVQDAAGLGEELLRLLALSNGRLHRLDDHLVISWAVVDDSTLLPESTEV